jgi:hypothetical protein
MPIVLTTTASFSAVATTTWDASPLAGAAGLGGALEDVEPVHRPSAARMLAGVQDRVVRLKTLTSGKRRIARLERDRQSPHRSSAAELGRHERRRRAAPARVPLGV